MAKEKFYEDFNALFCPDNEMFEIWSGTCINDFAIKHKDVILSVGGIGCDFPGRFEGDSTEGMFFWRFFHQAFSAYKVLCKNMELEDTFDWWKFKNFCEIKNNRACACFL